MKRILFVCTGNTCRSPMAEFLLRDLLEKKGISAKAVLVESAGIQTVDGLSASEGTQHALLKRGIDASHFRSKALQKKMIVSADRIYAIQQKHLDFMLRNFPEFEDKMQLLGEGIADPYRQSDAVYEACMEEMLPYIEKIADEMSLT